MKRFKLILIRAALVGLAGTVWAGSLRVSVLDKEGKPVQDAVVI